MKSAQRIALVTGSARGIGKATAIALARKGVMPLIADINRPAAEATAAEIGQATGINALAYPVDLSKAPEIVALVDTIVARHGRLDILVNNAGILTSTQYAEVTEEEWDRVMNINLKSLFFLTREAMRPMCAQGWGRVVSLSSMAGRSGGISAGTAYVAAKAAVIGLTRHLARQVAKNGVTVNAVAPGTIQTEMLDAFTEADLEAIRKTILVGRLGKPEEIAETIAFLASDAAAFITGAVIDVNGGNYMA